MRERRYKKGPFDKYYKPNEFKYFDREGLRESVIDMALKCWVSKGIANKEVLASKIEDLRKRMSTWTMKQTIIVGNKYHKSFVK